MNEPHYPNRSRKVIQRAFLLGLLWLSGSLTAGAGDPPPKRESHPAATVQVLSGAWKLALDPENKGRGEEWFARIRPEAKDAPVPGIIQQVFPGYHGVAWYWHGFRVSPSGEPGERVLIRFGAVDYLADVWINGKHAGAFEGGETPFEFDITDSLRTTEENLLAVRVLNPTDKPIDGYTLDQTPHRNKVAPPRCGSSFNSGGIMYPVELRRVPVVYVTDLFVQPELKTGMIKAIVTVRNGEAVARHGTLRLAVASASGGDTIQTAEYATECAAGLSEHAVDLSLAQPRRWSLEDPHLYRVTATIATAASRPHAYSARCGFRDFRVVDGYFQLNGQRLFLKSTHTGNHMPVGQQANVAGDFGRRDLIYAKASGFNTVRFIAGVAYPEQLDLCDELGLMVYEECFASWVLGDSPQMAARFDRSTSAMIRRDRNHPSVTIWGLLNETQDGPVFRRAVAFLPKLRQLDLTRLALLGSGRWDGQLMIGSASNPGSLEWQPVWGVENPTAKPAALGAGGYVPQAGDAHYYPGTPQAPETDRFIRLLGHEDKPVLLSEYGIGSQMNVINEWRHFEQAGARADLEDAAMLREQSEALAADWSRWGFQDVYAFPEDFLRESQRLHARQRTIGFNCIRSNPKLCGYNLTGMLDHGMTGEGLWTFWREWKPATFDAVSDGWSPLRWCLFVEPTHAYIGRQVTVEAVLANEDTLKPGDYPALFRVFGPLGPVWEKRALVRIPASPTLAVPVIKETFELRGPPGQYQFAANLEQGGAPAGGRLAFYASDPAALPQLTGEVTLWGISPRATAWLTSRGLSCQALTGQIPNRPQVVLVGQPADGATNAPFWANLTDAMSKGSTVVFLSGQTFQKSQLAMNWLPLKHKGSCRTYHDWLYHKDCVSKRHPVFEGLAHPGVMDWDYYGPLIPNEVFEGLDTPTETLAAAFATGNSNYPRGYGASLLMAAYQTGEGRFILSTPHLLENLDAHPAADRLLLNLIRYAQTNPH